MYVELKNINKTYGDYKASDNVSFGIEKGKLIGLLGYSPKVDGTDGADGGEIQLKGCPHT